MDGRERRKYERIPFRADIIINGKMSFRCIDLSRGGLYVYTGRSFEEDSIVDVAIPSEDKKINVRAKVRHNQPGIGMGLEFIDLTDEQSSMIEKLVESVATHTVKARPQKKRVLLIEDDDHTRKMNRSKLFAKGVLCYRSKGRHRSHEISGGGNSGLHNSGSIYGENGWFQSLIHTKDASQVGGFAGNCFFCTWH